MPSQFWDMSLKAQVEAAHSLKMQVKAHELMDQGYRRVSNKHCIISRVDRPDWRAFMSYKHAPGEWGEGHAWVVSLGEGAADHYRRVYSKDTLTVSEEISRHIGTSSGDPIKFVPQTAAQVQLQTQKEKENTMTKLHKFKIHGAETVRGERCSAGTSKFYGTYRDAEEAARRCVAEDGCEIVIFEAIKVVKALTPPMVVEDILKTPIKQPYNGV